MVMTSQPFPRCLFTHRTGHLEEYNTGLYLEDCGLTTVKRYHHASLWGEKFRSSLAGNFWLLVFHVVEVMMFHVVEVKSWSWSCPGGPAADPFGW